MALIRFCDCCDAVIEPDDELGRLTLIVNENYDEPTIAVEVCIACVQKWRDTIRRRIVNKYADALAPQTVAKG